VYILLIACAAEPDVSKVTAYWESGRLMSAAVETGSDVYILEVGLTSCFMFVSYPDFCSCSR